jgi:hypothetical protein
MRLAAELTRSASLEARSESTDQDDAQMFTNNGRELIALAKAIREQTPNAEDRVRSMSGGEVLCTALIAWLRDGDDPRECVTMYGRKQYFEESGSSCLRMVRTRPKCASMKSKEL